MNRKYIAILTAVLIVSIGASAFLAMTWTDSVITMTAGTSSVVSIGLFQDCATTVPFTTYNWDGVVQDQIYEVAVYVKNTGTQAVYITYSPATLSFDGGQTRFAITVNVIEGPALPCQLNPITPVPLPVKDPTICTNGFLLTPGKVIKLDVMLTPTSLVAGGSWNWNFIIAGCAP